MGITYSDSGVDVARGDAFVEKIKTLVGSTMNPSVKSGIGGYASLYERGESYLAAGTDGVGTKLKVAQYLNKHDTVGIDLVAMCVNDIICTGAKPLFFLDYLATSRIDPDIHLEVVKGITQGCRESEMALIGGETAEMPGMYSDQDYDLAGFAVGDVEKSKCLTGNLIQDGDLIVGLASNGLHSNGFSLFRKLFTSDERKWNELALTPTKIYVKNILQALEKFSGSIHGLAHITGGGYKNIGRLSPSFDYHIDSWIEEKDLPEIYPELIKRQGGDKEELFQTFNMGIGMAMIISPDILENLQAYFLSQDEKVYLLGQVNSGSGTVKLGNVLANLLS